MYPSFGGVITTDYTTAVGNGTTANNINITLPSGIVAGDAIVVCVANDNATATAQWNDSTLKPTGYTVINQISTATADACCAAFWKIADGSEASATLNIPAQSAQDMVAYALRLGAGTFSPTAFVNALGANIDNASASAHPTTGVATSVNECLILSLFAFDGADTAPYTISGTGWSEIAEANTSGGTATSTTGSVLAVRQQATSGAGVDCTATITGAGGADGCSGFQFAIAPYTLPAYIREIFKDANGNPYPDGTSVKCYRGTSYELSQANQIGTISGIAAADPNIPAVTADIGEVTCTFGNGDTGPYFLVLDPDVDTNGIVTNYITPTQVI